MSRLTPYGSAEHAHNVAKVGKKITPVSLASRMPSREIVAKVGVVKIATPMSLATRMPSPEIAAKVGNSSVSNVMQTRRLVRRNAKH